MRRKISRDAARALRAGQRFHRSNTSVDDAAMYVHNSCVAARMPHGVQFSLAGWPTILTRERINAVFDALMIPAHLYQTKGKQMVSVSGEEYEINDEEVYLITNNTKLARYFDVVPF
jgi:hypothetical protein